MPHVWHFPKQAAAIAIIFVMLWGANKLGVPRWGFVALAAAVWLCVIAVPKIRLIFMFHLPHFGLVFFVIFIPALLTGTVVGEIAAHRGSRFDGDIAMAVIVGCALFQWGQQPKKASETPNPHIAINLDTKLLDACVGQYEFAPDNVFPVGMKLTIWRKGDQLIGQAFGRGGFQGPFDIYPESETNFFLTIHPNEQLTFIKNDNGEMTAVIDHEPGVPVFEGKKLLNPPN